MPIYEYRCTACGAEFESIRAVSRADDANYCKLCNGLAKRMLSNFSFKSDTFTSPKLRNRPAATFRGSGSTESVGAEPESSETTPA